MPPFDVEVFITGASGVVGSAVLRRLVEAGHDVRALSRSSVSDATLAAAGASPVKGDILDRDTLGPAIGSAEVVFHVAGVNEMCGRDSRHMLRANVEGSTNVVDAAHAAGVRRIVFTSSAAVLGEERGTIGSEASAHRGWYLSEYERSKHLAERAVLARAHETEIVSVNPSSVQGPGRTSGTGRILLDLVRGKLPYAVDTSISVVDIDDCARGHLAAAERGRAGARYVLNSFTISMRDALSILEGVLGRELDLRFLPRWAVTVGGWAGDMYGSITRRRPPLCSEVARTILHGHRYDGSMAAIELGIEYTTPDVLLSTLVDWYRSEGLIAE